MYPLEKQNPLTSQELHNKAEEFAEMLHTPAQSKQDVIGSYIAGYSHGHYHAIVERKTNDEPVVPKDGIWLKTYHFLCAAYMHGNKDINQFVFEMRNLVHAEEDVNAGIEEARKKVEHYNETHNKQQETFTQLSLFDYED